MEETKARCKVHEDREAVQSCERCGDFACEDCLSDLLETSVCESCAVGAGLRDLDRFQEQLLGQREAFVWFFGVAGALMMLLWLLLFLTVLERDGLAGVGLNIWLLSIATIFNGALHFSYFMLKRWSRKALFAAPFLGVLALALLGTRGPFTQSFMAVYGVTHLLLILCSYLSPRNRLAFGVTLGEDDVRRLFKARIENRMALLSVFVAIPGMLFPPFLLLSLILGGVALGRCGPESWPLSKGRHFAYLGLALAMSGLVAQVLLFNIH